MKLVDFKKAEQLAEALPFDILLYATFIGCKTMDEGNKLKEAFPKEWEDLFKTMVSAKMIKIEGVDDEKSD